MPPLGVYAIEAIDGSKHLKGIANLGVAPTMGGIKTPLLEVHLFNEEQDFLGRELEIIFKRFIRPEKKFESVDDLRHQIYEDIRLLI